MGDVTPAPTPAPRPDNVDAPEGRESPSPPPVVGDDPADQADGDDDDGWETL